MNWISFMASTFFSHALRYATHLSIVNNSHHRHRNNEYYCWVHRKFCFQAFSWHRSVSYLLHFDNSKLETLLLCCPALEYSYTTVALTSTCRLGTWPDPDAHWRISDMMRFTCLYIPKIQPIGLYPPKKAKATIESGTAIKCVCFIVSLYKKSRRTTWQNGC